MDSDLKIAPSTSEESDSKSYLCIPIPTKSTYLIPRYMFSHYEFDEAKHLFQYKEEHSKYLFTPRSEMMIRRVIKDHAVPREFQNYPLVKLFFEISCEFMFSELELAAFAIYLNRFVWSLISSHFTITLYAVALAVKFHFNNDVGPFAMHLSGKIQGFLAFFSSWMNRNDEFLSISLQELNKVLTSLTQGPFDDCFIDLNYYVDSILEMAPASVYEKPMWLEQLTVTPYQIESLFDIQPPCLAKLDSVLEQYPDPPMFVRGFSTNSNTSFSVWPDFAEF